MSELYKTDARGRVISVDRDAISNAMITAGRPFFNNKDSREKLVISLIYEMRIGITGVAGTWKLTSGENTITGTLDVPVDYLVYLLYLQIIAARKLN